MALGDPADISITPSTWNYVGAVAIVVAAWFFRVEMIRVTLRLLMRGLAAQQRTRSIAGGLREFEKLVLHPLSYVVFMVFVWIALSITSALQLPTINTIVQIGIGIPMLWTARQLCKFLHVMVLRRQGWDGHDDDAGKVMIVTEGIGVLQYVLCAVVFYYFFLSQLQFDTVEIFTTLILVLELLFLLSSHTWFRNVMGGLILLIDEPIKSGSHIKVLEIEGVVEHMYLQFFTVRQYDQGLAIVPNGILLTHEVHVRSKSLDARIVLDVHLAHETPPAQVRAFVRNADRFLSQHALASTSSAAKAHEQHITAAKLSLTHVLQRAVKEKTPSSATRPSQPVRFWVTLDGLYRIQLVYYVHENKFKHLLVEKRELMLGLTSLLATMGLSLYEPPPPSLPKAPPSTPPRLAPIAEAFTDDDDDGNSVGRHACDDDMDDAQHVSVPYRRRRGQYDTM
ncbi:hypothetical protein SPRG_18898 [Saprolegnia parasitica CBS 223.65]|uniref:Mechanosensitive ion channel MscS domain-containing protein n=1 Tax=Saprolegnia parasitica (strain CBS 223.65) TaxID=695850 RepID=A0A067DAW1_SAPPC|nr:hypothetical protein SPRG_18898 [Saprolegnia parasitica CBS 223.65]KDO35756.1 hypothetical protein SPRG_18898 [Saprolegnia parasitica CBS 223.65]|eukprot:XP_012194112.1 hypothetical protein SPRG_18898 [Saprolegnia parasitica CBS 223.65]